ncbi:hypothetical protein M885DRAFT_623930, partial [Pelagophyceae sp. CCMP2097]
MDAFTFTPDHEKRLGAALLLADDSASTAPAKSKKTLEVFYTMIILPSSKFYALISSTYDLDLKAIPAVVAHSSASECSKDEAWKASLVTVGGSTTSSGRTILTKVSTLLEAKALAVQMGAAQGLILHLNDVLVVSSDTLLKFHPVKFVEDSPGLKRGRGDDLVPMANKSRLMDAMDTEPDASVPTLDASTSAAAAASFFENDSPFEPSHPVVALAPLNVGVLKAPAGLDPNLFGSRVSDLQAKMDTFEVKLAVCATFEYVDAQRNNGSRSIIERLNVFGAEIDALKSVVSAGFKDQASKNLCLDAKLAEQRPAATAVRVYGLGPSALFYGPEKLSMPLVLEKFTKGLSKSQTKCSEKWLREFILAIVPLHSDRGHGKGGGRGAGRNNDVSVAKPHAYVLEFKKPEATNFFLDSMAAVDFTKPEWKLISFPGNIISLTIMPNWIQRAPQNNSNISA